MPTEEAKPSGTDAFLAGLLRPSGASLLGMVLFALAELGAITALATPRRLADLPPGVLMAAQRDDYAKLTLQALRLKYRPSAPLSVVYLGPSVAQRALFDSMEPGPIEETLQRHVGQRVQFWSLIAAGETLEETALLTHYIPKRFRGVAAIVVFEDKDDDRSKRLALQKNAQLEERLPLEIEGVARRGFDGSVLRHTGIYFLDHLQFFTARRAQLLHPWRTWVPLSRGGVHGTTPPAHDLEERTYETRYKDNPMALVRQHLGVLADAIETAKASGATVVLVEAPSNPRWQELKGEQHETYRRRMRAFADEQAVEYWDINAQVGARRQDFEDAVHLGAKPMRQRFQTLFCRRVADRLRGIRGAAGGNADADLEEDDDAPDDER